MGLFKKIFIVATLIFAYSCSSDDSSKPDPGPDPGPGPEPIEEFQLVLSASEQEIEDGNEIVFTVKSDDKEVLDAQLYINDESIEGYSHVFETAGTYSVIAKKEGFITSEIVKITVHPYEQKYDVFLTGYIYQRKQSRGFYWQNTEITPLDAGHSGTVMPNDIYAVGNDVYVAGQIDVENGRYSIAKYWKNSMPHELTTPGGISSEATGVFVSGNDVYVSGAVMKPSESIKAFYWKNTVPVALEQGEQVSRTSSIFVSGNDVYVTGFITKKTQNFSEQLQACYWKNGTRIELEAGNVEVGEYSDTRAIVVKGNDVYITGYVYRPSIEKQIPVYWKNGQKFELPGIYYNSDLAIAIDNEDNIHIIGTGQYEGGSPNDYKGVYWKNGAMTVIENGYLIGIKIINNDVLIGGTQRVNGKESIGYWKNGEFNLLTTNSAEKEYTLTGGFYAKEIPRVKK